MWADGGSPDGSAAHRQTADFDFQPVAMKKLLPLTCLLLSLGASVRLFAQTAGAPTTPKEKLSYALGMNFTQNLKKQGVEIDPAMFSAAMKDVMSGGKLQMTEDQGMEAFKAAQQELQSKQQATVKPMADKNKATGSAYLVANKAKPGVLTLPSGLQYKVLAEGNGASPKATDTVTVKYKGTLIDGNEFDNSDKQPGGTVSFPVNGVIAGWTEALQKMKVGAKWQLFIPSDLAYGDRGQPPVIPPGSTLLFDVELVKIGG